MYKIERRPSGFVLTFGGSMEAAEMQRWYDESIETLKVAPSDFGVIVDMRSLAPLKQDAQAIMVKGQQAYKLRGMKRSCVVVNDATTMIQFKRLAKESGIYSYERYLDGSKTPDWSAIAVKWVKDSIDPDL